MSNEPKELSKKWLWLPIVISLVAMSIATTFGCYLFHASKLGSWTHVAIALVMLLGLFALALAALWVAHLWLERIIDHQERMGKIQ